MCEGRKVLPLYPCMGSSKAKWCIHTHKTHVSSSASTRPLFILFAPLYLVLILSSSSLESSLCVAVVALLLLLRSSFYVDSLSVFRGTICVIITTIYPLTARVVGAPQIISQPVFSIFPCSPLPSGTCRTHLFLCLPCLFPSFTVLCKVVLARPDERQT